MNTLKIHTLLVATFLLAGQITGHHAKAETMDPRLAGARFGQALGAKLLCYGMRTTNKAEALPNQYTGADAKIFTRESDKVLDAWRKASTCHEAKGPNECRLLYEASCRMAFREIGPNGSELPGLIEPK